MKTAVATPDRLKRCRYRRLNDEPCANEALDQSADALIYICMHHAGRVIQMVAEAKAARLGLRRPAS